METGKVISFETLTENVGRFNVKNKTFLIPQMNRIGGHLLAATFRGFGIRAKVMDTFKGMDLGKEYTSGKECYPCQITTGDILYFLTKEKERLGDAFDPEDYVYFMPESDGPCRFGMYNKYQRIVLDSFPELKRIRIGALTTRDGYALDGLIDEEQVSDLRKASYFSVVVADILDRLLWRIRPYEKEEGMTDAFIEEAMHRMEDVFETYGPKKDFDRILDNLEEIIEQGKQIIDPAIPPKPLIGIVGEIYVRTHVHANQDLIRMLERYGGEAVNASIAEWMNYTSYDRLRDAKIGFRLHLKQLRFGAVREYLKRMVDFWGDLFYQELRQKQVYNRVKKLIDLADDHKIGHLEKILKKDDLFTFDVGTEACLSISGIVEYAKEGFNGVVNVYPFTCMPSTTTSAIVKPLMDKLGVPYLDTPYDSGFQPGREAAIRTFMYQAHQHFKRHGRIRASQR
ncbi:MAG: CoA activase [Deltaproteobacteria bacterium]|nr:MAG: CoA activase [Deltaproteobacteria bacterium]